MMGKRTHADFVQNKDNQQTIKIAIGNNCNKFSASIY